MTLRTPTERERAQNNTAGVEDWHECTYTVPSGAWHLQLVDERTWLLPRLLKRARSIYRGQTGEVP